MSLSLHTAAPQRCGGKGKCGFLLQGPRAAPKESPHSSAHALYALVIERDNVGSPTTTPIELRFRGDESGGEWLAGCSSAPGKYLVIRLDWTLVGDEGSSLVTASSAALIGELP